MFNRLLFAKQRSQLNFCRLLEKKEFQAGVEALIGKKIVIIGAGSQGLNQGLNLRDSGLNVSFVLRKESILQKSTSWHKAVSHGFVVGVYDELVPTADIVGNLTQDKQHSLVLKLIHPLLKKHAVLWYSHGFNVVEEKQKFRDDLTVILLAPKGPGWTLREEYKKGLGLPALVAVHPKNDPKQQGIVIAKALAVGIGSARVGVLHSSFTAEVKADLMGEQTVVCGLLQAGSILCFDKMIEKGLDKNWSAYFVQHGWYVISNTLKTGGIAAMMQRLSDSDKIRVAHLSSELKKIMSRLYQKHMDDILSRRFSRTMKKDWKNGDRKMLNWREALKETAFEQTSCKQVQINEQEFFDKGLLMISLLKAGIELAFETMVKAGIAPENAYYDSLYEVPLLAGLIAKDKLYHMSENISDTAEYGCHLFDKACRGLLTDLIKTIDIDVMDQRIKNDAIDDHWLRKLEKATATHPVEMVGKKLREWNRHFLDV